MAGTSKEEDKLGDDGLLFINENGHSIHFVLLMEDSNERDRLKRKVESRLGCVSTSVDDIGPYTLVLTDLANMGWKHPKVDRFQIGYISACFEKKRLLDVFGFCWDISNNYKHNFDYMKVISDRMYTWGTIPAKYLVKASRRDDDDDDGVEIDSDTDSNDSFMNTKPIPSRKPTDASKKTRDPYSRKEKENIVKYIIERKLYDKVKGREMWQELERLNVNPKRTWQSMKEHAIKSISRELHTFGMLTPKEREKLRTALTVPKHN
ncbi:uncharacterized protein LOC135839535 [Planococcus citri]|uniref:uncharacterized protein LOC135839535 n=1 Tax=Planococcus citri TaxID=170843 RepID=UPI0031F9D669